MSSVTPDIFDKEDIYIVSETHKQVLQKYNEKVASFQYKKSLYDGQIKSIQLQVDKRIQLLKDPKYEKTFKQFPELLSYYVQKQASMNQSLDNVIQSIKDEWSLETVLALTLHYNGGEQKEHCTRHCRHGNS